jgi:hypothetical protein
LNSLLSQPGNKHANFATNLELRDLTGVDRERNALGAFEIVVTALASDDSRIKVNLTDAVFHKRREIDNSQYIRPSVFKDKRVPVLSCFLEAAVEPQGRVLSGDAWIAPDYCHNKPWFKFKRSKVVTSDWKEQDRPVFSIALPWGTSYFHQVMERLTRLAEYHDELLQNENVLIHTLTHDSTVPLLNFMGYPTSRIIAGAVQSPVVFYPRPTMCSKIGSYGLFKLRDVLVQRLLDSFKGEILTPGKHILVIFRSGPARKIRNYSKLLASIKHNFPEEKIVEFRDDPTPSLNETLRLFYEAKVIVAAHGAGLTNLIVAPEGTGVVEFLINKPNFIYRRLSRLLGLRYEGTIAKQAKGNWDPITVDIQQAVEMVRNRLEIFELNHHS